MHKCLTVLALTLFVGAAPGFAQGDEGTADAEPATLGQAIRDSVVSLGLRYRIEQSNDDAFVDSALASTLRTSLKVQTKAWRGLSFMLEAEDVSTAGAARSHHNGGWGSLNNGVTDRPTILDPALTAINQAAARIERGRAAFTLGRTELLIGDQRFVGAVGWRQHHQAFDAAALDIDLERDWSIRYAFLDRVHRITGVEEPLASHVVYVSGPAGPGTLALYGYLLDYERPAAASLSTSTRGVSYTGQSEAGSGAFLYELQYALQDDWADHPRSVEADYQKAGIGFSRNNVSFRVVREVLDGDGTYAFRTPLATLHGFNGWTDKFLATPVNGLEDVYLRLDQSLDTWNWTVRWHQFTSTTGSMDYGTEIDGMVVWNTPWKQDFGIKLGQYNADDFSRDTLKIWVWTQWSTNLGSGGNR